MTPKKLGLCTSTAAVSFGHRRFQRRQIDAARLGVVPDQR